MLDSKRHNLKSNDMQEKCAHFSGNAEFSLASCSPFLTFSHQACGSNNSEQHTASKQLVPVPTVLHLHMLFPLQRKCCHNSSLSVKETARTNIYPLCKAFTTLAKTHSLPSIPTELFTINVLNLLYNNYWCIWLCNCYTQAPFI